MAVWLREDTETSFLYFSIYCEDSINLWSMRMLELDILFIFINDDLR